jgi:hypothetical protein
MSFASVSPRLADLGVLLRGESRHIIAWMEQWEASRVFFHFAMIGAGAGAYAAAIGWWHAPLQACYAALKLPLVILLTTLGNALLNAMLAPLLGLNISFRQCLLSVLTSFTLASVILGSFSPLAAFLVWNASTWAPGEPQSDSGHAIVLLAYVGVIALAGIASNLRLFQLLTELGGSVVVARRVLFAWLAGNLFLGSQFSWILRPFIGLPWEPVRFLSEHPLRGNFYESVFGALRHLFLT